MFKSYPKMHRLGHEENDGILIGNCYIQEKIDGANTSIWNSESILKCGTRTREIPNDESFNGFHEYVNQHEGIRGLLAKYPHYRLYGEWLVRHTIAYNELSYKHWYLFDIYDDKEQTFLPVWEVYDIASSFLIKTPELFAFLRDPSIEELKTIVGKSSLGEKGEGIVIKNFDFKNKFGVQVYAKLVTEKFKEENALVFGGNNKHSDTYWEMYAVNKFMTLPRVQKVMNKIQPLINERLDREHTARIINTAYHDMITEEIWDIQKKIPSIRFKTLSHLASRKAAQIYHDLLGEAPLSVADLHRQERIKKQISIKSK